MKQTQYIRRDTFSWIMSLFIVAFLCVLPTANADVTHERFTINDIEYLTLTEDSENRTVAVVSYSGEPTTINIPDSVIYSDNTYTVTTIWVRAFQYCTSLVSVTLPDSITTIRSFGFDHCINLSSITIPDNVTSIEDDAFEYCINLSSITIGKSLVSFGMGVFNGCSNLANIIVNTDNPSYSSEDGILFNKDKTELIQYPCGKKEKNYTTPNYTTTIGRFAFGNCRNLISVTISDSVTHITRYAFSGCSNLKDVVFGKRVCSMEYSIFNGCTSLKHVYYKGCCPGGTPTLYYDTPETLTSYYNTDHEKSWAPYIQNGRWLNRKIRNIYGIEYIYNTDGTASVESIALTEDTDITIPATVEKDGVSYTVTSIPDNALDFRNIPTSITIPASVTFIGRKVFFSCENLKAIHVAPENPVYSSVDGVLFNKEQTILIQYPSGREGEYTISSSVYYIEKSAFSGCTASISLIFSEGIEIIEPNTFYRSTGLQKIQLPPTLKVIGEDAFFGCVNLVEVNIPDSVTSIGAGAFANCKSLEEIEIPNYVEEIGDSAFYGCENLRFAYIPDSLVEVGAYMFNYCHSLESVIIGASVREIQVGAFLNCENLRTVYFLGDHPELDYEAFLISNYFRILRDSQNPKLEPQTNPEVYLDALQMNTPVLYYLNDRLGWYSLSYDEALDTIRNCGSLANLEYVSSYCLNYTVLEANADDFDISGGTILSYKGNSPVVVVPDRINGTAVTQIGENAFANNVDIFIIIIPGSVEVIGDKAFANCASLQTVQFRGNAPEAAENIFDGDHCVVYCESGTTGWDAIWNGVTVMSIQGSSDGDFTYEINDKEITITGYTGTATHLEIPSEIEEYPVTQIKEEAFFRRFDILTVFVPKSVTYVGFGAFANCRNLYSVEFEGETEIEDSAFYYCRNLSEIILPEGLDEIKAYTFTGCTMLQEIDLPGSLTYIGDSSFYKCASLQDIVIPQNVTEIADNAFACCEGLTNVVVPDSVTSIGSFVFNGCDRLPSILFSTGKKTLIRYSSSNTDTSYIIPDTVTYIAGSAFFRCTSLESIEIPNTVTVIGDNAFSGIRNLVSIEIPNSVTSIGNCAFDSCSSLRDIVVPDSVTFTGDNVFFGCSSLTNVNIGNGVISIGDNTFYKCSNLTSVTIPNNVTSVGNNTFSYCTNLTSIMLPNSVTSIGNNAFSYCSGLTNVTIPNGVTEIGSYVFYNCSSLESVDIGKDLDSSIEYTVFSGCTNLSSITVSLENPVYSSLNGVLFNKNQSHLIICPGAQAGTYIIPDSVTSIGNNAFYNCHNLASITISDSVISIGDWAFYNCNGATSITIGNSVTTIGNNAFYNCNTMNRITIPDSVISIGNWAFYNCIKSAIITIGNNVTSIGDYAFSDCRTVTRIVIPDSVTSIGDGAFYRCIHLKIIKLPDGITSIRDYTFTHCSSLANITIPDSVTSIGDYAFYGCTLSLFNIIIPSNVTSIGYSAFCDCSSMASIYFKGNAPTFEYPVLNRRVTVYCHESSTGWDSGQTPWDHTWAGRPVFIIPDLHSFWDAEDLVLNWTETDGVVLQSSENGIDDWTDITEDILTDNGYCVYRITSMEEAKSFYRLKIQ